MSAVRALSARPAPLPRSFLPLEQENAHEDKDQDDSDRAVLGEGHEAIPRAQMFLRVHLLAPALYFKGFNLAFRHARNLLLGVANC